MASDPKHRNTIIVVGLGVLVLVVITNKLEGPSGPPAEPQATASLTPPSGPTDFQMKLRAQSEIKKLLRDPDSAEFFDMRVVRTPALAVCGYVNSRNGFGGMTGRQRFISGAVTALEEQMEVGGMDNVWSKVC